VTAQGQKEELLDIYTRVEQTGQHLRLAHALIRKRKEERNENMDETYLICNIDVIINGRDVSRCDTPY
jgi:hypothetical protein